ncbi:putative ribonuclease H protein [Vitis vinifera]|uniref:Putative ribonuclease H protein n=1 Tax=Vitis vinifera TaxID=29760 RepID=A0A438BYQ4_VITVI|nr:putative ribonuclease H protein [Vitis vinifera]
MDLGRWVVFVRIGAWHRGPEAGLWARYARPESFKRDVWAADGVVCGPAEGRAPEGMELLSHGPAIAVGGHLGQRQFKYMGIGSEEDLGLKMEMEFIKCWEKETRDKQMPVPQCSMAEREIVDEAFKYGSYSNLRVGESSLSSSSLFGRTPEREFCDHSGDLRVSRQREICHVGPQVQRSEKESDWEESSLAKFSKLLGFSIEGLEREILDFLSKIRKRCERIHSKGLLEKTKFERELKRRQNPVNDDGVVKSLGVGRFLEWRTIEAAGAVGGVLVCWDKSLGVHGCIWPFNKKDRECLWDELGAVKGLWGDPWCVGGDFNVILAQEERSRQGRVTPAMRRFAQVMDDLELIDLPLQGDLFINVTQKRLSRLFQIISLITIEGGGKRRGPSPFRFENMWLRVEGFKDLLGVGGRGWWEVFGNLESNKLAALQQVDIGTKWKPARGGHLGAAIHGRGGPFGSKDMNGDKAPGPDGFTGAFWQFCWEFVKEEVMEMFKEFHEHNTFLKSLNATFLVLIPKKGGAEELGDFRPISLLGGLYKLLAKVLANRIKNVIGGVISSDQNALSRNQRGRGQAVSISHLLFADDAIVFCEAKKEDMTFLSWTLCWFEAASGLRINLAKSEIIPVGEVDEILEMAVELGCKVGQLPSTYLGLPWAPNKAGYVWDGVEERMRWKLALWKRQYLSKGGRITLIKSTLASMPLYQLSLFRMPKVVVRRFEKLQRDFLWGGGSTERKAHLVSWEKVCVSKEKGGLGLRKIVQLNKALLGKWVWRFACAKDEMWKRVLVAKYGQEEFGWRTKKANETHQNQVLEGHLVWGCGAGPEIPSTLQCGCSKSATVGELWDQNVGQGSWNLRFFRSFNDWELALVDELLQILRSQRVNLEEDLALWKGEKMGSLMSRMRMDC